MNPIVITLHGNPRGKGRPRFSRKSGHAYTPAQTRAYETELAWEAQTVMRQARMKPLTGPVSVRIIATFSIPKSWPKVKAAMVENGLVRHISKPDLDNVIKEVGDALNKIVWVDDSQINEIVAKKQYGIRPRLEISVISI